MRAATLAMAVAAISFVSGCSDSPMVVEPSSSSSSPVLIVQRPARGKITAADQWIEGSKLMRNDRPDTLRVGNDQIGYSYFIAPANALPQKWVIVTMRVSTTGPVLVEFGPEGLRFNRPTKVVLSYRGADLSKVNESSLRVYYNNEKIKAWELMPGGSSDHATMTVRASLEHFSQYAVGSEE